MDNLRKSIQFFFGELCSDKILENYYARNNSFDNDYKKNFFEHGINFFENYGFEEINNVFKKLEEDWFFDVYNQSKEKSMFNLLIHFNKQVLTEENKEPFVNYENLLKWRDLSHILGEDLFTCSYLAYMDNRSKRERFFFAWRPVIFSNNRRLKGLLSQGTAENHFHLKGSGPVFDLSWMALMNNINTFHDVFKTIKKEVKLKGTFSNSFSASNKEIDILVYKAAHIRNLLFEKLNFIETNINDKSILCYSSNYNDSFETLLALNSIQNNISLDKELYGYSFYHKGDYDIADYAIPKNLHQNNFEGSFMLVGERKFLYDCFTKIYSGCKEFKKYQDLFHAYLLIKNVFRAELIQVNKKVGFGNFSTYQDRKENFIKAGSIYETAFLSMAINDFNKFQNIQSFETRIAPKENVIDFYKSLVQYQKNTSQNCISDHYFIPSTGQLAPEEHFYVVHFIKKKDKINKNNLISSFTMRHQELRKEVKKQAETIVRLRESSSIKKKVILGIDAASSEFAANPEVFAQAFRYLKDHKLKGRFNYLEDNISEFKLKATYHVGEDFYDIVDGIRSIDEAINYLNLRQGDRLGHALALGIDVKDYYEFKGKKLMLPKEVLLDNIVWILAKATKFNIFKYGSEIDRLKNLFESLFWEIYSQHFEESQKKEHFSYYNFYDAWKLRSDDPSLYHDYKDDIESKINTTYWERCRINYFFPKNLNIRKNEKIKFLYYSYHYNAGVKKKGSEIKQFSITDEYILLVSDLQRSYMTCFKTLNIGIETNPTSNYLIGTFKRYSKHPIKTFYNLGLEIDSEKIKDCPQLFVSINTDDQGIFGTSLENEYALMAIALEKEKDENGKLKYNPAMIYQWLDNIRKMGLEQSFRES